MPVERDVFSDQRFAVQVTVTRPERQLTARVDQVLIGGRPAGLYGLADKSHLVAWLSFCDGLRAELAGLTLESAIDRVYALLNLAERLPSQSLADALRDKTPAQLRKQVTITTADDVDMAEETGGEEEVEEDEEGGVTAARSPRAWHADAAAHVHAVRALAHGYLSRPNRETVPASSELQLLQSMIAAYLHARNTIPLTAIDLEHPAGPPQEAAAVVRQAEAKPPTGSATVSAWDQAALRKALWGLLDERAVATVATKPGMMFKAPVDTFDPDAIAALAIADHIITMEQAYPKTCAAADFRGDIDGKCGAGSNLALAVHAAVQQASATRPTIGANLRDWPGASVGDSYDRFAVQLEVDGDGNISKMYVGARPRSGPGRHVTAYVALCDYVRGFLIGFPMISVEGNAVIREAKRINSIANSVGAPDLLPIPSVRPQKNLWSAQAATADFLTALNSLKGSITDTGGTSGGGGEGKLRAKIKTGGSDLSLLTKMLDPKCLEFLDAGKPDDVTLMALRIALHLYFTGAAYPQLAKQVNLVSEETIAELLFNVNVDQLVADDICTRVLKALRPVREYDQAAYIRGRMAYTIKIAPPPSERNSSLQYVRPDYEYNSQTGSQQSGSSQGSQGSQSGDDHQMIDDDLE